MSENPNRKGLTPDERLFLKSLDTANADLMISIFAKVNGYLNEEMVADKPAPAEPEPRVDMSTLTAEKSAPADKPARELDTDLVDVSLKFIEAWKRDDTDTLQALVDQKRGPALPPSHVARERTRARAIAPDLRFRMMGVLEQLRDVISDTAYEVMSHRPHYQRVGIFENDVVSNEMLHGICEFLSLYPDINQMANEYHVYPFFDVDGIPAKRLGQR